MREFNTGSFPKGLSLMLGAMKKWNYDESPTDALKFEEPLAELKASIAESGSKVFQDMIKDFLVNNMHRTTVELAPSKTLEAEIVKVCTLFAGSFLAPSRISVVNKNLI